MDCVFLAVALVLVGVVCGSEGVTAVASSVWEAALYFLGCSESSSWSSTSWRVRLGLLRMAGLIGSTCKGSCEIEDGDGGADCKISFAREEGDAGQLGDFGDLTSRREDNGDERTREAGSGCDMAPI